jgi:hypothetical protein
VLLTTFVADETVELDEMDFVLDCEVVRTVLDVEVFELKLVNELVNFEDAEELLVDFIELVEEDNSFEEDEVVLALEDEDVGLFELAELVELEVAPGEVEEEVESFVLLELVVIFVEEDVESCVLEVVLIFDEVDV